MKQINLLLLALIAAFSLSAQPLDELIHLTSYESGMPDAAEVVAYDFVTKKAFFTSAAANTLTIVDIEDPSDPILEFNVDLSDFGAAPNSVSVLGGIVCVAMEMDPKTDPGSVLIFDTDGFFIDSVTTGSLPDMLTFSSDYNIVAVANEGEPNDDYSIDPEGSVTIIDFSGGIFEPERFQIKFDAWNDRKVHLQNKGVRLFGNNGNSTVAQDLEPEYCAFSPDGALLYVNCQENNAVVVIDVATKEVLDIFPLGYKDHELGAPEVEPYVLNEEIDNWPELGTPVYDGGQDPVLLGGFSGLWAEFNEDEESLTFYSVPDRGPNDGAVNRNDVEPPSNQNLRPFKLPEYQGRIIEFKGDENQNFTITREILLTRKDGVTPISGRGNVPGFDEVPVTYQDESTDYPNTDFTDNEGETYHQLDYDEYGGDFEGVLIDRDGYFWLCDEYRPSVYKFDSNGVLQERYVPEGTSLLGDIPQPVGTYGAETLPPVYAKRWANRGFEGIAYDSVSHTIYAFIQSPMFNPDNSTRNNSDVIRILGISADDGAPVSEYVYLLERNQFSGLSTSRVDKIGDSYYAGNGIFYVLERDSELPEVSEGKKYVFKADLTGATNILGTAISMADGSDTSVLTLEQHSADELLEAGVQAVHKTKMLNLPSLGYKSSDKPEGLVYLEDEDVILVLNDNDFGLAGAGVTDSSVLGVIVFDFNYDFDASNEDGVILFNNWPTLGMYQPDAIGVYSSGGKNYIVTANEGDARDYDGYSEEDRVKDLILDEGRYPDAESLQEDENLGRLKTTTARGDYDGDGDVDQIYSYGARSVSIWDEYGNQVWDSGNEFGTITASEEADLFNEDEGEFDGRSDDKGVEPEALAIGEVNGYTYAFVGLERQSAILVYDITDPYEPFFVTYYQNRTVDTVITGDVAPETISFLSEDISPNGMPMLLVGYEVSGTMGIILIDDIVSISEELNSSKAQFEVYPNPVSADELRFDQVLSGDLIRANGEVIRSFKNQSALDLSDLSEGMYLIRTEDKGVRKIVRL